MIKAAVGTSTGTRVGGGGIIRKPTVQPRKSENLVTETEEDLVIVSPPNASQTRNKTQIPLSDIIISITPPESDQTPII
jgi:hypothetical protein